MLHRRGNINFYFQSIWNNWKVNSFTKVKENAEYWWFPSLHWSDILWSIHMLFLPCCLLFLNVTICNTSTHRRIVFRIILYKIQKMAKLFKVLTTPPTRPIRPEIKSEHPVGASFSSCNIISAQWWQIVVTTWSHHQSFSQQHKCYFEYKHAFLGPWSTGPFHFSSIYMFTSIIVIQYQVTMLVAALHDLIQTPGNPHEDEQLNLCFFSDRKMQAVPGNMWYLSYMTHSIDIAFAILTRCSWQETKVWNPGATPKPSWSMNGGSFCVWIWTLIPASNEVSSINKKRLHLCFECSHSPPQRWTAWFSQSASE